MKVAGLVLAAGSSRRLGPTETTPGLQGPDFARRFPRRCSQRALRPASGHCRRRCGQGSDSTSFDGFDVVESEKHTDGCSSSIVSALAQVKPDIDGFVLLLGDQPGVRVGDIETLLATANTGHSIAVCRYDDGIGHPFWFARETFVDLAELHGDKAVWKVIESGKYPVHEVTLSGNIPLDVDTWDDYEQLLASTGES